MKRIAITLDDAPTSNGTLYTGSERAQLIIEAAASRGIELTFFATPKNFAQSEFLDRLSDYNDAGHLIASHTNTHPAASFNTPQVFLAEIDAAVDLLDDFSNYRPWFRFPFLDEGNAERLRDILRDGLDDRSLLNGYATIDTWDWHMQTALDRTIQAGDAYDLNGLRDAYVEMILAAANHYEAIGQDLFGRSIAHTLLLHENDLAALFLDDAIDALRADGWEIISADEAYADPIADIETQTLAHGNGKLGAIALENGYSNSDLIHAGNRRESIEDLLEQNGALTYRTPPNPDPIFGTPGNDTLFGNEGNDSISSEGSDTVVASAGNDRIDLGAGYDQVNYSGGAEDYRILYLANGLIRVEKPEGGADTLIGVDGFWFSGERRWYSADLLADRIISSETTDGNDRIYGSYSDDTITSLSGSDTVIGSKGNDIINLGDGYDQVNYLGSASDYVFTSNADGSISVEKPNGDSDTLIGIDGFWFYDEERWYSPNQLAPSQITGTDGDDIISGTPGDDTINGLGGSDTIYATPGGNDTIFLGDQYDQLNYNTRAADYSFSRNADGSIRVEKPEGGIDTLHGVDGFWFNEESRWYSAESLAGPEVASSAFGLTDEITI